MDELFRYPQLLPLAPLVALPIIIHLLNRIRYRRVRWAAIEFLLTMERRAVRRAKLRQILLMALRMLLLAAALGALMQPRLGGGLAALLGGSRQVAVVLDASASMSASGPGGSAFDRAKALAAHTIEASLPRGTLVAGGAFAESYTSPFREPLLDRAAVAAVLRDAQLTGGRGDVPRALRSAAEALQRGGGGGVIWLLSDLQASGWRAADAGEWQQVREALARAGKPHIVITDLRPAVESNLSFAALSIAPAVPIEGDAPTLTATVELRAKGGARGAANVALFLDGERKDSRTHEFAEPGKADVVFKLPRLKPGPHAGSLELSPDALPGDDRACFVIHVAARIPVLVVDGAPSSVPFDSAGDFVKLALRPPESALGERSQFAVEAASVADLAGKDLGRFAAVVLADVAALPADAVARLRDYASGGGLVLIFPGEHTQPQSWNEAGFPGVPIGPLIEAEGEKRIKLGSVSPTNPAVANLPAEGLDRVLIARLYRLGATQGAESLIQTERGEPFLVRRQLGKGKVYLFAVSAQVDFSNLPFTPPFLLLLHRVVHAHLVEGAAPLSLPTFTELKLALPPGAHLVLKPDGRAVPVMRPAEGEAVFAQTELAGVYRLAAGTAPPANPQAAPPIAALNTPPQESELELIGSDVIQTLLPDTRITYLGAEGGAKSLGQDAGEPSAASAFPLAVLALVFLIGEVLLAWSLGRPTQESVIRDS